MLKKQNIAREQIPELSERKKERERREREKRENEKEKENERGKREKNRGRERKKKRKWWILARKRKFEEMENTDAKNSR